VPITEKDNSRNLIPRKGNGEDYEELPKVIQTHNRNESITFGTKMNKRGWISGELSPLRSSLYRDKVKGATHIEALGL